MKKFRMIALIVCAAMCIFLGAGCSLKGNSDSGTKYTPQSKLYSISLPDIEEGWTQVESSGENTLVLDNSDMSFTIMIQAFPGEEPSAMFSTLDEMENFYHESMLQNFGATKSKKVKIGDPAVSDVRTHNYLVEQDGVVLGAELNLFRTENAFYSVTITGMDYSHDTYIDMANEALKTFKEK